MCFEFSFGDKIFMEFLRTALNSKFRLVSDILFMYHIILILMHVNIFQDVECYRPGWLNLIFSRYRIQFLLESLIKLLNFSFNRLINFNLSLFFRCLRQCLRLINFFYSLATAAIKRFLSLIQKSNIGFLYRAICHKRDTSYNFWQNLKCLKAGVLKFKLFSMSNWSNSTLGSCFIEYFNKIGLWNIFYC